MNRQHWLTLREASRACGKSIDTIKRYRQAGRFPHAVQDRDAAGTWRIPIADLFEAGLEPVTASRKEQLAGVQAAPPLGHGEGDQGGDSQELAVARAELAAARQVIDAQAAHIESLGPHLADLRRIGARAVT
jgi:hypothetical protein